MCIEREIFNLAEEVVYPGLIVSKAAVHRRIRNCFIKYKNWNYIDSFNKPNRKILVNGKIYYGVKSIVDARIVKNRDQAWRNINNPKETK